MNAFRGAVAQERCRVVDDDVVWNDTRRDASVQRYSSVLRARHSMSGRDRSGILRAERDIT